MRSSKGGHRKAGHVDQLIDGYRPRLAPGNLVRILAKGQSSTDLIHTESAHGFRGFGHLHAHPQEGWTSSARPLPKPEHAAARSAKGKQPFKYGTVPVTTLVVQRFWFEGAAGRVPNLSARERASSKARDRTTPGSVLAFLERLGSFRIQAPGRPPERTATRGGKPEPSAPTARWTERGRAPPGSSTLAQARDLSLQATLCWRDHLWHLPTGRSTTQGVCTGGAAATDHGAPRETT